MLQDWNVWRAYTGAVRRVRTNPIESILLRLSTPVYWLSGPEGMVEFDWLSDAVYAARDGAQRRPDWGWQVVQARRGRPYRLEYAHDPGDGPPDGSVREPRRPRPRPRSGAAELEQPD
jgi:hypothetical protein